MSPRDLEAYQIYEGKQITLEFEGGLKVQGDVITGTRDLRGRIQLITFKNCIVKHFDKILFKPEWGIYDMAIGKEVVSAYSGPADVNSFLNLGKVSETKTHKIKYSDTEKILYGLYSELREIRENNKVSEEKLTEIFNQLKTQFPKDWLLSLELYELALQHNFSIKYSILKRLEELKCNKSYTKLIDNGLALCHHKN